MLIRINRERIQRRRRQQAISRYFGSPSAQWLQGVLVVVATVIGSGVLLGLLSFETSIVGQVVGMVLTLAGLSFFVRLISGRILKAITASPTVVHCRVCSLLSLIPALLAVLFNGAKLTARLEEVKTADGLVWLAVIALPPTGTAFAAWLLRSSGRRTIRISHDPTSPASPQSFESTAPDVWPSQFSVPASRLPSTVLPEVPAGGRIRSGAITAMASTLKCSGCGCRLSAGDQIVMCKHDPPHRAHQQCSEELLANKCPICGREFHKKTHVFST
jgi:hypothetical protein